MEFLKAQITRIQEQLAGLSATQKMLTFSLLTIMVMTLMWWSHWAAEPEMSPILDQDLSQEDLGQITANLEAQGIPHRVVGSKVMVPADRKLEILAVLGYSQALPRNFDSGFDQIIKQMNWLDPPDKTDQMFLRAKEQTLASVIRLFPGVQDAVVVIDPTTERHIGSNDVQPVATVTLTTSRNNKAASRQLAESAADVICGAQAGLLRGHINVIVDGVAVTIKDRSEDGMSADDMGVEAVKNWEDYYRTKIEQSLQDVRGVMVSVTVKLNTAATTTTIHKIDPKQTVSIPTQSEETSDETTAEQAAQQDVGAVPNAANNAMTLGGSGGGGGGTTSSTDKSTFDVDHGKQDEVIKQGPGDVTVLAASVRVPRSYFIQTYKIDNGGKEPDDPATLANYMTTQLAQIRGEVKGCAVFPSDDALVVGSYSDLVPPELPVAQAAAVSPVSGMVSRHSKEIGVGFLAVISLFMVSMMVRKGAPAPAVVEAMTAAAAEEKTLNGNDAVVGNATQGNASLDGMELDEESVKAQQMLDQVQQMVTTNPDAAASLVTRWMNR